MHANDGGGFAVDAREPQRADVALPFLQRPRQEIAIARTIAGLLLCRRDEVRDDAVGVCADLLGRGLGQLRTRRDSDQRENTRDRNRTRATSQHHERRLSSRSEYISQSWSLKPRA